MRYNLKAIGFESPTIALRFFDIRLTILSFMRRVIMPYLEMTTNIVLRLEQCDHKALLLGSFVLLL